MATMHWMASGLIADVRALSTKDERYANWERGYVCGQIAMLSWVEGVETWEYQYAMNLYRAKCNRGLTGV